MKGLLVVLSGSFRAQFLILILKHPGSLKRKNVGLFKIKFPPLTTTPTTPDPRVNIPTRGLNLSQNQPKAVWAIGGGKGGIGKTLLTSNMAVYLSWLNKKVVVIDMDLGGANLHTSLGVNTPTKTLSDLILNRVENIQDLIQATPIRNLSLVSGAHDPVAGSG